MDSSVSESRVLIIYTGGTIGMLVGSHGYVPEPYFLTETLRSQSRFHDPFQDSLFSHSASVEHYREWSTTSSANQSGRSSPLIASATHRDLAVSVFSTPTLLVRSSRPIGTPASLTVNNVAAEAQPACKKVSDNVYEAHLPSLVTPRSSIPGGAGTKRIRYAVLEWNPLLDSSNIETDDWIRIATEIELNYAFDAFVILHGTDTMCYTSSALSFLLEDLGKTVILTGAQIPLSQLRNDAVDNLMGALSIAGHYIIPECCLFFNHTLFRGNRVSKTSSFDFNAFSSPNFPPLVQVGIDMVVSWNDVIRQTGLRRFRAHKVMSRHIATLRLFPGINAATTRAFLLPPTRGVVLEAFGAGNAPQRKDLVACLKEACDRGVVIVAISQCAKGSVGDAYDAGRTILDAGVIPGWDMTPECALTKLSYLLSKPELSPAEVRKLVGVPLRGELTPPAGTHALTIPSQTIFRNLENIQCVLSQFIRLSRSQSQPYIPDITISSPSVSLNDMKSRQDTAAPWSWTASEATSAEAALLPFLIHLAAARDDLESMSFCLESAESPELQQRTIPGGLVNCTQQVSGSSPLHVAALNGSERCVDALLRSGALVHLRDLLDHTALYYAARQGHERIVDVLVQAGASLGGADLDRGLAMLHLRSAVRVGDEVSIRIWNKAGLNLPSKTEPVEDKEQSCGELASIGGESTTERDCM